MRAAGRVLLAVVAVSTSTVAAYPTNVIASSPAPPIITFSGETSTFSPNGDGQDDTIDVITYVDQLIAIAINITTSPGTHVRNLPRYADVTRCGGDDNNPSFRHDGTLSKPDPARQRRDGLSRSPLAPREDSKILQRQESELNATDSRLPLAEREGYKRTGA